MKTIEVGAFEAKTHLSQLLDEVERGALVTITRRGKAIAVLRQDEGAAQDRMLASLGSLRNLCRERLELSEVLQLRDAGRER